jgi:hypothetical protein
MKSSLPAGIFGVQIKYADRTRKVRILRKMMKIAKNFKKMTDAAFAH